LRTQWKNLPETLGRLDEGKETDALTFFAAGYPPDLIFGY